mmetsp:Transcript_45312/g.86647  ORF Transcript_45312/g.86647 Transcript_45312/m.86647 type:complete len:317 (+) Transcript_45312:2-952(+)
MLMSLCCREPVPQHPQYASQLIFQCCQFLVNVSDLFIGPLKFHHMPYPFMKYSRSVRMFEHLIIRDLLHQIYAILEHTLSDGLVLEFLHLPDDGARQLGLHALPQELDGVRVLRDSQVRGDEPERLLVLQQVQQAAYRNHHWSRGQPIASQLHHHVGERGRKQQLLQPPLRTNQMVDLRLGGVQLPLLVVRFQLLWRLLGGGVRARDGGCLEKVDARLQKIAGLLSNRVQRGGGVRFDLLDGLRQAPRDARGVQLQLAQRLLETLFVLIFLWLWAALDQHVTPHLTVHHHRNHFGANRALLAGLLVVWVVSVLGGV